MVFGKIKKHIKRKRQEFREDQEERRLARIEHRKADREIRKETQKAFLSERRKQSLRLAKTKGKVVAIAKSKPRFHSFVPNAVSFQQALLGPLRTKAGVPSGSTKQSPKKRKTRKRKPSKKSKARKKKK